MFRRTILSPSSRWKQPKPTKFSCCCDHVENRLVPDFRGKCCLLRQGGSICAPNHSSGDCDVMQCGRLVPKRQMNKVASSARSKYLSLTYFGSVHGYIFHGAFAPTFSEKLLPMSSRQKHLSLKYSEREWYHVLLYGKCVPDSLRNLLFCYSVQKRIITKVDAVSSVEPLMAGYQTA
jgi:hypothetical protein